MAALVQPDQFLDPRWRLSNLYKIVNKDGKSVKFEPNWAQMQFLEAIHSRNLILKARQLGFTTFCCLIYLDDCLFTPNVQAAVIAHKLDDAKIIFKNKVKFPYDNLDDGLKASITLTQDSADTLALSNNSSMRVSTSTRSGTVNWLHVSEYGKICAQFPDKAEEIRSGAFPSAERGVITIESTAEGEGGDFHETSVEAEEMAIRGVDLTRKDYKFFFFPWWAEPTYAMARTNVPISDHDTKYFDAIEAETKTVLTPEQRNWWVTEERRQGGNMKREYPATAREAFEQALEGAIFADDLAAAYKHERIGSFPLDSRYPVNTFWDLGRSHGNATAVWLEQDIDNAPRFVSYYEKEGEVIDQHLRNLRAWGDERGVTWGDHWMPFDGDRKDVWTPDGTVALMGRLGFRPKIITRTKAVSKWELVQMGRRRFSQCYFDEAGCKVGINRLKKYRKEWDERRGVWRDHPYHGPESNGADAFLTFAESGHNPSPTMSLNADDRHRKRYYDREDTEESWVTY